jgi:hypothetical protein
MHLKGILNHGVEALLFCFLLYWGISPDALYSKEMQQEEQLIFKDGTVLNGKIISEENNKIKIQTWEGETYFIDKSIVKEVKSTHIYDKNLIRSPYLAGIFSAVLPGSGQVYNEEFKKAIIGASLFYGSAATAALVVNSMDDNESLNRKKAYLSLGLLAITTASYIYLLIDAPYTAYKNNKKLEKAKGTLGFIINPKERQLGLSLRF